MILLFEDLKKIFPGDWDFDGSVSVLINEQTTAEIRYYNHIGVFRYRENDLIFSRHCNFEFVKLFYKQHFKMKNFL